MNSTQKRHVKLHSSVLAIQALNSPTSSVQIRLPNSLVTLYPDGDILEGKVSLKDAEYLAQYHDYEVEGFPRHPGYPSAISDFIEHGDKEAERKAGVTGHSIQNSQQGLMELLVSLMGGGQEAIKAAFDAAVAQKVDELVAPPAAKIEQHKMDLWMVQEMNEDVIYGFVAGRDPLFDADAAPASQVAAKLMVLMKNNPILEREVFYAWEQGKIVSA